MRGDVSDAWIRDDKRMVGGGVRCVMTWRRVAWSCLVMRVRHDEAMWRREMRGDEMRGDVAMYGAW